MVRNPAEFREAVASGDAARVNGAIDEAQELGDEERAQLFEECFDEFIEFYQEGDGYQRLSAVRFLRSIASLEISEEYWDGLWEFYVEAIQDDDGRVRNAAASGIHTYVTTVEVLDKPVEPLQTDLEEVAGNYSGEKREDIEDVLERIQQVIDSPLGNIFGDLSPGPPRRWEDLL